MKDRDLFAFAGDRQLLIWVMTAFSYNGGEIYYEHFGDQGSWVTLINGHTRSSRDFRTFAQLLKDKGHRVAMLDNRGSGKTTSVSDFAFSDLTEDIEELWRVLGITKTSIVGISMGGVLAQHLAKQHPEKVDRLVLISTTPAVKFFSESLSWGHSLASVKTKLEAYFAPDFVRKNRLLVDSMAKQIFQDVQSGGFQDKADAQLRAMQGYYDTESFLGEIKAKTLILHGDEDRVISIDAAKTLYGEIKHSKLLIYENAGHLLLAERAKNLFQDVADFLGESFKSKGR